MDPGVRTFMTTYDIDGFYTEWGEGDMKRIFSLCLFLDKLISKVDSEHMKKLHGKKGRRKQRNHRKAIKRLRAKIKNEITELHKKLSTWLCSNYKVILIPKFEVKSMSQRKNRKIRRKTVRQMACWSHYYFRQRLKDKSELFNDCNVIECDEAYTSKTCGYCGIINTKLGSSKVFKCKQPNCPQRHFCSDRDIHAARNILLRYLTRNNIDCNQNSSQKD